MPLGLRLVFSILVLSCHGAAIENSDIAQRIQRGESFLTNLFDPQLQLLPEYPGSTTYWLFHDNYLAAHSLEKSHPELARRIRFSLIQFGITNSGKIEILFDEAHNPLPFRNYNLIDVAIMKGKTIRTEILTTNVLQAWDTYADLLFLASLARAKSAPLDARRNLTRANAMWDGEGFNDAAAKHNGIYSTYKLALYLIAAECLKASPAHRKEVLQRLLAMQSSDGGWITDYKNGKPVGLANVETTCLCLLALRTLSQQ